MIGVAGAPLYLPATETPAPLDRARPTASSACATVITQSLNGHPQHPDRRDRRRRTCRGRSASPRSPARRRRRGCLNFIALIGVISTAIGLLNLFPIPILDGGHFVAFLIEAVRGRPPSPAVMQVAMSIGLGLILLLMVFATYNDIMRMVS